MTKRPIFILTLGYLAGILWGLYLKSIVLFVLISIGFFLLLFFLTRKEVNFKMILLFFLPCMISLCMVTKQEKDYLEAYTKKEEIQVQGIVISQKEEKEYKQIYQLKVVSIREG